MKIHQINLLVLLILTLFNNSNAQNLATHSTPENFKTENLVAWCIVPFDALNRTPFERSEMLVDLGLTRVAYDWRQNHIAEFEKEILQYKKHNIEFFAFWNGHPLAFELFQKYDIHPQIWKTVPNPEGVVKDEKINDCANTLEELADKTNKLGFKLGLYNHGGWGGEPENMVAVCKELNKRGFQNVGIVYNFHHAHSRIEDFAKNLKLMKPYLLCLNLNGMAEPSTVNEQIQESKILPLGSGVYEKTMIQIVLESGYDGPIGILGHIKTQDVANSLQNNITGLQKIINE